MSKVKFLGLRETQGTFEGKPFHSLKLHIAEPFNAANSYGMETSVQSIKFEQISYIFGRPMTVQDIASYINSEADFIYNKKGAVTFVHFFADDYEPADKKK